MRRGRNSDKAKTGVYNITPPPEMDIFTCLKFYFPDSTERISITDLIVSRPSLNAPFLTSMQIFTMIGRLTKYVLD